MQIILFTASVLFAHDLVVAEPKVKCPSKCDVSKCPSPSCPSGYVPDHCNCCLVCSLSEGAPCGWKDDTPCGDGLECKFPAGKRVSKGVCHCKMVHTVCGSDGKTYGPAHLNSPRYKFNFIADVVEKIGPAVVHIELFFNHPLFGRHVPLSSGSGFIMTQSGLIVTNAHVVTSSATVTSRQQVRVQLHDGQTYKASIRDIDKKSDIATIKINPKRKLPVLLLGHSADLRPGEFVVAIGSPFALQNTVTTGIISTTQRDGKELGIHDSDMDYIQTDAIINYGNSGGPLVNLDGEVIGINTLKVTAGISFAIPSDRINKFLDESKDKQKKDIKDSMKRFIGIKMVTLTENLVQGLKLHNPDFPDIGSGILVHEVVPDSPAQKGGIETGDVIVKLNGRSLVSTGELKEAIQEDIPLLLEVRRGNDDLLFNIEPHIFMQQQ
ncbi:serine protease HTRA3-like isoform X2 [Myxocyprinus asiaticus]|uniref:serine protease HTRA3-like isoform X2 n=1 Tax=Myxocyprinus asiaticus TaxID=70543 RepID=UPI0022213801|nr:serine protease HTRA3-like isoform X2 [Myxocyprinus asiaticus]